MKRKLIVAAAIAAVFSAAAWAQMGPGMMGGYGPGGGYGPDYGMGPGMMGGYGMGPGMMGGFGPGGGMGPGMMGGYGMGPGMMSGYGPGGYGALNLSDEQRKQISAVQDEFSRKQWDLMGKMHEQRFKFHDFGSSAPSDDAAARKAYQAVSEAHKAMFENSLEARKRIDAVLTDEQRKQLRRGWSDR